MIVENKDKLSDKELEKLVDAEFDLSPVRVSKDTLGMPAMVKQSLELQHNYRERVILISMTLERVDRTSGETQGYVVFPLRAIDEDYSQLSDTITRAVQNMSRARS